MKKTTRSLSLHLLSLFAVACSLDTSSEYAESIQELTVESGVCRVDYTVGSEWGTGFGADVKITNKGSALSSWTLEWQFPSGQRVTSLWNGVVTQSGANVSVKDAGWNGALASGASVSFGFNGSLSGANGNPSGFKLNGRSCEGSTGTGGSGSGGGTSSGGASSGGATSTGGVTSSGGATGSGGSSSCNYPNWQQGAWYEAGAIVRYEGAFYIAEHANPGYSPVISTWFWDPFTGGCSGTGGSTSTGGAPPTGGTTGSGGSTSTGFSSLLSRAQFEAIFPNRNPFYTYDGLVQAANVYPIFGGEGSTEIRKREIAAFLANVAHETGHLVYIEEINKGDYADYSPWFCPPAPGKRYFGRGPMQLSWNYNYCAASQSIFGDREVLRLDPDRVAREPWLAWATAIWFWTTQTGAGTMTAHNAIVQSRGFGETIRTINGGLECNGANPSTVQLRINYFQNIASRLGVSVGSNLGC